MMSNASFRLRRRACAHSQPATTAATEWTSIHPANCQCPLETRKAAVGPPSGLPTGTPARAPPLAAQVYHQE
jgi:hypothetical protein